MARKVNQLSEVKVINDNDSFLVETSKGSRQVKGIILKRLFREAKLSINQFDPNSGKITLNLLDDEVLDMMTGNTPINSVPTDYSITHIKLAAGCVSSENLNEELQSVLCEFVEDTNIPNYVAGAYKASDGTLLQEGFHKLITVEPSTTILVTGDNNITEGCLCVFFDKENSFISSFMPSTEGTPGKQEDVRVLVPQNCHSIGINTLNKDTNPIVVSRLSVINYADKFRDLNTKVEEYKEELDATDLNLDDRLAEAETKLDDIGDFQDTRDAINNLYIDNKELERRISDTEDENPFAWRQFEKTQVVFMIDAGTPDLLEVYNLFKGFNIPVSISIPTDKLDVVLSDSSKMKDKLSSLVKDDNCEVLSRSLNSDVFMNSTSEEEAERRFRQSKLDLVKLGFDVNGFVKPTGNGSLPNLSLFEHLLKKYYRYGILCGENAPYNITRVSLNNTLDTLKNKIEEAIVAETFIIFECTDVNSLNRQAVEGLIQHILIKKEINITTLKKLYENYRSTTLANKIAAGIDIESLLEVNQVKNADKLIIQTENGPKKITKANFDNVLKPFEYAYSIWYPSGFPKLPFRVYKDIDNHYRHEFNINNEFIGEQIYVSCKEGEGSDTNGGLSPETCLVNLSKAIEVANKTKGKKIIINILNDIVDLNKGPLNVNFTLEKDITIRHIENKQILFTSANLDKEWDDHEGIYQSYQTQALNVRDNKYKDLEGLPLQYERQVTINAVKEKPGSFFISDTNYVYVNTIDGRRPDSNIIINTSVVPSIWNISDHKLVFNNITFLLSHVVNDQVRVNGNNNSTLINYGCKFINAGNNGLLTNKVGRIYSFDCVSADNAGHGFNYTTTLAQGVTDLVLEFNCRYYNNGNIMSGAVSGSIAQDGLNIIRINSSGHTCDGPICCDKNGCHSLLYGCSMCNSIREPGNTNTGFWFDSELSNRYHEAFLIDCAGDSEYSLNADTIGDISLKNFKGVKIPEPIKRLIQYL